MKKSLLALALAVAGLCGTAQAALITVPFTYNVTFVDATVAGELNLSAPGQFNGQATYDDSSLPDAQGVFNATALTMNFGDFHLTEADDISGFGVGVGVSGDQLTALYFETHLNLVGASAAGTYLLSFFGTAAQLTPAGDTTDFKATASLLPAPGSLPLVMAAIGVWGWSRRLAR